MTNTTLPKVFFGAICLSMIFVTIHTSLHNSLWGVLPRMIQDPWTVATLIDFYFNILIFTAFVYFKERSWKRTLGCFIAFVALGSIATSGYVLWLLYRLKPGEPVERILYPVE